MCIVGVCVYLCVCLTIGKTLGVSMSSTIAMGRLRLVGSLKLYVSFAKEPYKRDYILQKRHKLGGCDLG